MNARQMKKRMKKQSMKKQIDKLQSDNDLMHRIISNSPTMQELYDVYTNPLNITCSTMLFQEYRSKRFLPPNRPYDAGFIALFKQGLAKDLFEGIKEYITYDVDAECMTPTITASILVGKKRG